MTTPAMDSTGVTGESSGSAETSPSPSAPSEINKSNSKSQRSSTLPPYFRSYEAYIEHCMAQVGREEMPGTAFDRLCASCTTAFKKLAKSMAKGGFIEPIPLCTVNAFLSSAAEVNCHVCHWFMAGILRKRGNAKPDDCDAKSLKSGVDWLERGNEALILHRLGHSLFMSIEKIGNSKFAHLGKVRDYKTERRVRGLPTALTTASDASWNQALKWIENCRSHPLCNPVQAANAQDNWPARLVEVGTIGETCVRVCETSRDDFAREPYVTLSHCWGKNGVPTRLMEENYVRFLNGIQLGELPKTFRDAIDVTRRLNIPFIWIDSLCIIQNSYEDWIEESAKMQQVYQNSFLNLAAGASADANGGLFHRRHPLSITPWCIRIGEDRYLMAQYINEHTTQSSSSTELILYTRGWVLQEQLLARRTLVFGQKELHWECSTCQASESFPDFLNRPDFPGTPMNQPARVDRYARISRPDWQNLLGGKLVDLKRQEAWNGLTRTYFERSLTRASDRLVAISGLAEQLSSRWSGITYLAGLWSYRLISGLLWYCLDSCSQRNTEIAPSWSWASLIQPGELRQPSKLSTCNLQTADILAEVLKASAIPKSRTNPFGPITVGGSIKLRSPVLRARSTGFHTLLDTPLQYFLKSGDNCNLDTLEHKHDSILVRWDEVKDIKADIQHAYLVPFMIQKREYGLITLAGLILMKTAVHSRKPQFRRAGYFSFNDRLSGNDFFDEDTDDDSVNGIDDGHDESSQDMVDNTTEDAVFQNQDSHSNEGINTVQKSIHQAPKKKGLFRDIDSWFAKKVGDGLEERMDYLKKDPYVNGPPLNTTLENRYLTESGIEALPKISRFLEAIAQAAKNNKANGTPDPVLGYGEGNGYYTYEIV